MRAKLGIGMLIALAALLWACSNQDTPPTAVEDSPHYIRGKRPRYSSIASSASIETTFTCGWDAWISVDAGFPGCINFSCVDYDLTDPVDTCRYVQIGKWNDQYGTGGECGRAFGTFDFDTGSLPDDAVVEDARLRLHVADVYVHSQEDPPQGIVPCNAASEWVGEGGQTEYLQVGFDYGPVGSIGQVVHDSVAYYMATECRRAGIDWDCCHGLGYVSKGDTVWTLPDRIHGNFINTRGVTRFIVDSENPPLGKYLLFSFYSMRNPVDLPAGLCVKYRPPSFEFYGAALGGASWAGFDTVLAPDLEATGAYQSLAESLAVYLVWQNINGGGVEEISTPIRLDQAPWWGDPGFDADDFQISVATTLDGEYHACPEGQGPEVTLNSNGTLLARDLNFGGIGTSTKIELRAKDSNPDSSLVRVIVLQWNNPDSYYDVAQSDTIDAVPGTIVTQEEMVPLVGWPSFEVWTPTLIVEWVSTDIAGLPDSSLRVVDAADLAALVAAFGQTVSWGHGNQTRNYHLNCAPFGSSATTISGSDLSAMSNDLGDECSGASKPTGGSEREAILAWFGIQATGELVPAGPGGALIPEYAVVDWDKARRAIADPYGYRRP